MWLFTRYGFFSVVVARKGPGSDEVDQSLVMVRARARRHLEALLAAFPQLPREVRETRDTDYPVRLVVKRAVWDEVAARLTAGIDYTNFKDEAHARGDAAYDRALHEVWSVMFRMQGR